MHKMFKKMENFIKMKIEVAESIIVMINMTIW